MTFKLIPKGIEIVGERGQGEGRKLRVKAWGWSGSLGAVGRSTRHLAGPGKRARRAFLPPLTSSAFQGEPPEPPKHRLRPSWSTSCEVLGENPTHGGAEGRGARGWPQQQDATTPKLRGRKGRVRLPDCPPPELLHRDRKHSPDPHLSSAPGPGSPLSG